MDLKITKLGSVLSFKGNFSTSVKISQIELGKNRWIILNIAPEVKLKLSPESYSDLEKILKKKSSTSPKGYELFTDGSAIPNPGPGGWGAALYLNGQEINHTYGGAKHAGNGKMEVMGMIKGLELIPKGQKCQVWSDSQYVVNTIGQGPLVKSPKGWISGWRKRVWKKANGEPPENLKEIKTLYQILIDHIEAGSKLSFAWVKAHAGTSGNERADELADMGREEGPKTSKGSKAISKKSKDKK